MDKLEQQLTYVKALIGKVTTGKDNLEKWFNWAADAGLGVNPATIRTEYHHCYAGGLLEYVYSSIRLAEKLAAAVGLSKEDLNSLLKVLLILNTGKMCIDYYDVEEDQYWKSKGRLYRVNPKYSLYEAEDLTVSVLLNLQVSLTADELFIITNLKSLGSKAFMQNFPLYGILVYTCLVLAAKSNVLDSEERNVNLNETKSEGPVKKSNRGGHNSLKKKAATAIKSALTEDKPPSTTASPVKKESPADHISSESSLEDIFKLFERSKNR